MLFKLFDVKYTVVLTKINKFFFRTKTCCRPNFDYGAKRSDDSPISSWPKIIFRSIDNNTGTL